jgi:hypothetical protein
MSLETVFQKAEVWVEEEAKELWEDLKGVFAKVETSVYNEVKVLAGDLIQAGLTDIEDIEQGLVEKYEAQGGVVGLLTSLGSPVLQAIIALAKARL